MKKPNQKNKQLDLVVIGFALLLPGMFLAAVFASNYILQTVGLILIVASSAFFGASINQRLNRER